MNFRDLSNSHDRAGGGFFVPLGRKILTFEGNCELKNQIDGRFVARLHVHEQL